MATNNINDIQKHRDEILKDYQIKFTPTLKSLGALVFSGIISTFGIYSIIVGMVDADNLQIALGFFVLVLIVADTVKRSSLAKYYNSIIRKEITKNGKVLRVNLFVSALALLFMVVFDFVGAYATANYAQAKYSEFQTTDSKEFELLETKATNAKSDVSLYKLELATYQKDKADASVTCAEEWKGWKSKYKAKCKKEWEAKNPKPIKPTSNTTVSVKDYSDLKNSTNDDFLSRNIFNIVLFLSLALTMILQYTTVSEIKDNYDNIKETLTILVLGILQDRLAELETNMIVHETKRNDVISQGDKREKEHQRDFEKLGKAIELMTFEKAVESRENTVLKIANNENIMEAKKAGFVATSFSSNPSTKKIKNRIGQDVFVYKNFHATKASNRYVIVVMFDAQTQIENGVLIHDGGTDHTEKANAKTIEEFKAYVNENENVMEAKKAGFVVNSFGEEIDQSIRPNNQTNQSDQSRKNSDNSNRSDQSIRLNNQTNQSESVQTIDFREFNQDEINLLYFLWAKGTIKQSDQLITKKAVLKAIGDNRGNSDALTKLYKKLNDLGYISKHGVHYVSEANLPTDVTSPSKNYDFDLGEF